MRKLTFPVNPDQQRSLNIRTTVVQTINGIYTDKFGIGIQSITLSGDTAWNSPNGSYNGQKVDGNTAARHLEMDIVRYYLSQQIKNSKIQMFLYDDVRGQAWQVEPIGNVQFTVTSKSPVTLQFSLQFVVIRDLLHDVQVKKPIDDVIVSFSSPNIIVQHVKMKVKAAQQRAVKKKQTPLVVRVVQSGDTLWTIAQDYLPKQASSADVESFVNKIVAQNHISNPNLIFVGQNLRIPA
jgi:LysM repeat protein